MRNLLAITAAILLSLTGSAVAQNIAITAEIVRNANTFLSSLSPEQRQKVLYAFDDAKQRTNWSNFPIAVVPRGGISLKEMNATQRARVMALLSSVLSRQGFEKVQQIMEGDQINKNTDTGPPRGGNNAGGQPPGGPGKTPPFGNGPIFGKDLYFISFLGKPSQKDPWMLQFGGHHLALNITIAGEHGVLTPTLTGAQPALYTFEGKTVRPLRGESDKALALLNALDDSQKRQAILSFHLADLVLGPGQDGKTIQPEGLKASAMNDNQRAMLLDIISEWANIIHQSAADDRMAELKADLNETWFAWSGPITAEPGKNITAYYRIQGPHVVIEYAPQRLGGDPSMHVHTMYRDPTNDYGRRFTAK
jgi:hypothetical protein